MNLPIRFSVRPGAPFLRPGLASWKERRAQRRSTRAEGAREAARCWRPRARRFDRGKPGGPEPAAGLAHHHLAGGYRHSHARPALSRFRAASF